MKATAALAALGLVTVLAACGGGGEGASRSPVAIDAAVLGSFIDADDTGPWAWSRPAPLLLGSLARSDAAAALGPGDREIAARTTAIALQHTRDGATSTWSNPRTGHTGSVTPVDTREGADGGICRALRQTASVAGKSIEARGIACRGTDGTWQIK